MDLSLSSLLDTTELEQSLGRFLRRDVVQVEDVAVERLARGTSGDQLYTVAVSIRGANEPVRLLLKMGNIQSDTEAEFYRTLAPRIPIATPYLIASGFRDRRSWLLMEVVQARDGTTWTEEEYQAVVEDMAALHGAFWGRTQELHHAWLWLPTPEAIETSARRLRSQCESAAGSWLAQGLPEMFAPERLALMRQVVKAYPRLARQLIAAGEALVHGDYWFHNVLLALDGRRILIDWQGCRVWSGFWEFAYFLNLLRVVGPGTFRPLPLPAERLTDWYRGALARHGIDFADGDFTHLLTVARVLQPVLHWLPQVAPSSAQAPWEDSPAMRATRTFLDETFTAWEGDVRRLAPLDGR